MVCIQSIPSNPTFFLTPTQMDVKPHSVSLMLNLNINYILYLNPASTVTQILASNSNHRYNSDCYSNSGDYSQDQSVRDLGTTFTTYSTCHSI